MICDIKMEHVRRRPLFLSLAMVGNQCQPAIYLLNLSQGQQTCRWSTSRSKRLSFPHETQIIPLKCSDICRGSLRIRSVCNGSHSPGHASRAKVAWCNVTAATLIHIVISANSMAGTSEEDGLNRPRVNLITYNT